MDSTIASVLTRPGSLTFPSNVPYREDLSGKGGRVVRQASGHLVFYDADNRRFFATDPEGHPLHELDWSTGEGGRVVLRQARVRLDWGQWIGIRPGGLINSTVLDLSRKSGWEHLRADHLRQMAAGAMRVPLNEVRFFYRDDDLTVDGRGRATIRHRKDAFYVLEQGTFEAPPEQVRFMSCMGAMHWDRIDFLPVVELFQSLLPGTGSAVFELIRGLYDDQHGETDPTPLRYRGIPPYPSAAAFRLFTGFFTPQAPHGGDPFPMFMDPVRSCDVTWLPAPEPPLRYFDTSRNLCVTVRAGEVQKATFADDPTGLPYLHPDRKGFAPSHRVVSVSQDHLILKDAGNQMILPLRGSWGGVRVSTDVPATGHPLQWRHFFPEGPPDVSPERAYSAVLLYPDDETEIAGLSGQPFVADYLQDVLEQDQTLSRRLAASESVLISNFDGAINTLINLDRPRQYRITFQDPAFAQKHAQMLWNRMAQAQTLNWGKQVSFRPAPETGRTFDVIYAWFPADLPTLVRQLNPAGLAFVVGTDALIEGIGRHHLDVLWSEPVAALPTFQMHQSILPKARLKPGLTVIGLTGPG